MNTDALEYPADFPVKAIYPRVDRSDRPVVLKHGEETVGVIFHFAELVETHSFPASPFPVGQLLRNAVQASLLVQPQTPNPRSPWIPLRSYDGRLIALLARSNPRAGRCENETRAVAS